jgi:hypothetical protein
MQTEISAEQQELLNKLLIPFHPNDISWRVTNKSKDGKRGCVIPYGDQRAYTDRLNLTVTPAGWTRTYSVSTISPVTRVKKNQTIQTGKVIVTCVVTIALLGSHTGTGEMWADDENAMTRAEAQAFKRACSCFGLGRYFYDFAEMWVDLDEHGNPKSIPNLPAWALPPGVSEDRGRASNAPVSSAEAVQVATSNVRRIDEPLDPKLTREIEEFRKDVGDALHAEVFQKGGPARNARELPGRKAQRWVLAQLETIQRGIDGIRALAEAVPEHEFYAVLDQHSVESVTRIPSFDVLRKVFTDLKRRADSAAA